MPLKWETVKSELEKLGFSESFRKIKYIDDEGSEISVGSDSEFQEALRFAMSNNNQIKMILYDENVRSPIKIKPRDCSDDYFESVHGSPCRTCCLKMCCEAENSEFDSPTEEETYDSPDDDLEWLFKEYQKLNKACLAATQEKLSKQRGVSENSQNKKKKKRNEVDPWEKIDDMLRDVTKQLKIRSGSLSEFFEDHEDQEVKKDKMSPEELKRFDAKQREKIEAMQEQLWLLMEEKTKISEKIKKISLGLAQLLLPRLNEGLPKNSGAFDESSICIRAKPGEEFSFNLTVLNNGSFRWAKPRIECSGRNGVLPAERIIYLPKLIPKERLEIEIRAVVTRKHGFFYLKWSLLDGSDKLCQDFSCWGKVDTRPVVGESLNDSSFFPEVQKTMSPDDELITKSQKKIAQNINELEKRLRDLYLMGSNGQMSKNPLYYDDDCLKMSTKEKLDKGDKKVHENIEKTDAINELDSETNDTFVVVSPCKSPRSAKYSQKDQSLHNGDTISTKQVPESDTKCKKMESNHIEEFPTKKLFLNSRSCGFPSGEESFRCKPKKSKSTEYRFTAPNLSQPIFFSRSDNFDNESKFTFGGKKKEVFSGKPGRGKKGNRMNIRHFDSSGKTIYAVHNSGYCLPVTDLC